MADRIERLRAALREQELPGALIMNGKNVGYLSGFTGSTAVLLVTPERAVFITDSRYTIQAARECPGFEMAVIESSAGYTEKIVEQVKALGCAAVAVEGDYLTVCQYEDLRTKVEAVELKPVEGLVGGLRRTKDGEELSRIRNACALADRAFDYVLTLLKPGVTERDIAIDLETFMKRHGAEKEAFDTIVASGVRSALPHGRASDKSLEAGDFITFDFGAQLHGYNSDLTRTVVLGKATDRQREVYGIVLEANEAAIRAIRAGLTGKEVDSVARDLIGSRGYKEHFGHGLGHGLGIEVHDHPALSQRVEEKLVPGMVVTVEPGIYIPDWGGVRIEDDVLVTDDGCEVLTHAPKQLIEVPV